MASTVAAPSSGPTASPRANGARPKGRVMQLQAFFLALDQAYQENVKQVKASHGDVLDEETQQSILGTKPVPFEIADSDDETDAEAAPSRPAAPHKQQPAASGYRHGSPLGGCSQNKASNGPATSSPSFHSPHASPSASPKPANLSAKATSYGVSRNTSKSAIHIGGRTLVSTPPSQRSPAPTGSPLVSNPSSPHIGSLRRDSAVGSLTSFWEKLNEKEKEEADRLRSKPPDVNLKSRPNLHASGEQSPYSPRDSPHDSITHHEAPRSPNTSIKIVHPPHTEHAAAEPTHTEEPTAESAPKQEADAVASPTDASEAGPAALASAPDSNETHVVEVAAPADVKPTYEPALSDATVQVEEVSSAPKVTAEAPPSPSKDIDPAQVASPTKKRKPSKSPKPSGQPSPQTSSSDIESSPKPLSPRDAGASPTSSRKSSKSGSRNHSVSPRMEVEATSETKPAPSTSSESLSVKDPKNAAQSEKNAVEETSAQAVDASTNAKSGKSPSKKRDRENSDSPLAQPSPRRNGGAALLDSDRAIQSDMESYESKEKKDKKKKKAPRSNSVSNLPKNPSAGAGTTEDSVASTKSDKESSKSASGSQSNMKMSRTASPTSTDSEQETRSDSKLSSRSKSKIETTGNKLEGKESSTKSKTLRVSKKDKDKEKEKDKDSKKDKKEKEKEREKEREKDKKDKTKEPEEVISPGRRSKKAKDSSLGASMPVSPTSPLSPVPQTSHDHARARTTSESMVIDEETAVAAVEASAALTGASGEVQLDKLKNFFSTWDPKTMTHSWEINPQEIEFIELIGEGTSCAVYKGTYRGQYVALKILKDINTKQLTNFVKEFDIISDIRSPYVVFFFGACIQPVPVMVLGLATRGSLYEVLKAETPVTWANAIRVCISTLRGLDSLHKWKPQIVHRDLKSRNILLDEDWGAKLCDFGESRHTTGTNLDTLCKIRGTYAYIAPEVYFGQTFTPKSDVYAFGIILWELCNRIVRGSYLAPFAEYKTLVYDFQIIVQASRKGMRPTIDKNVPPALANVIQLCWDHEPANRPDTTQLLKFFEEISSDSGRPQEWTKSKNAMQYPPAEGAGQAGAPPRTTGS